jgi:hypothetical protein
MMYGKRIEVLEECCNEYRRKVEKMSLKDGELVAELKLLRLNLEKHQEVFENHDVKEMEKYDDIKHSIAEMSKEIGKFNRVFWIVIGAVAVMNFLGITDSVKMIIRNGVNNNYKIGDSIDK